MQIMKAKELDDIFTLLVYGENGTGKTDFMASSINCGDLQPSLILDCDPSGYTTIKERYPEQNVIKFDPDKKYHMQFNDIIQCLKDNKIKFFCIDGISFLHNGIIDQFEKLKGSRGGWGDTDWQGINNCIKKLILDCGKVVDMVCATALVDYVKDDTGKVRKIRPYLSGDKFPQILMSCFNAVARMYTEKNTVLKGGEQVEETSYKLSFGSGGLGVVKSRFHELSGKTLTNASMSQIWEIIKTKKG